MRTAINNVTGILVLSFAGQEYTSSTSILTSQYSEDLTNLISSDILEKSDGRNVWIPIKKDIFTTPYDRNYDKPYLYLARKINNVKMTRMALGYSIIQLRYERLFNILNGYTVRDKGGFSLLTDVNGTIICHTKDTDLIGTKLDESIWESIHENTSVYEGSFFSTPENEKYLMLYIKDKNSGWFIVHGIPYSNILEKSREIRNFTLTVMFICLSIAILLSIVFSKNITSPIIELKNVMDSFGAGNLKLRADTGRRDEIGKLQESFNLMAKEIRNLLDRVENENKQRRKLELNILEYQINPHFLYNTLDSINWMAHKAGQKDIGEMVTALARFFRIGLSKGKEFIKIKDELEHAKSYLIINKIRFKDCFGFHFDVEPEILDLMTIKLILQPLIENAVKHGMDKNGKKGFVEISGKIVDGSVLLKVADNGKGVDQDTLASIKKSLKTSMNAEDYGGGIGLMNVNQRIKLNFGSEYGLDIDNTTSGGATVLVKLPIITGNSRNNI